MSAPADEARLQRPAESHRDHVRGGDVDQGAATLLIYGDYFCPYCRRLTGVLTRLRQAMGDDMAYVFRQFPNEHVRPGAAFASRAAEAAGLQGKFWPMHDALFARQPPLTHEHVLDAARSIGLDMDRFSRDVDGPEASRLVEEDLEDGRRDGVTGTPTIFADGERYNGAWDFYSLLEALQQPVGARVRRTARAFANLPASAGLVLLVAAALALACANSPLEPWYRALVGAPFGIGPAGGALSMSIAQWSSEGLLAVFFLLVGLEIRSELTTGALTDRRAAILPVLSAMGGVLAPAAIYLALNRGPTAAGWAVPTSTDVAFTLGVLALLGARAPVGLKVFVAALAVADDILSMLTLAIFYPSGFHPLWLAAAAAAAALLFALNRWRVYAGWPYLAATVVLWLSLHAAGVHAALAGVALAAFLPTRPAPAAGPLLAQAATALAALEHAETEAARNAASQPLEHEPIWTWASRNLSAASERLLSPAERVEQGVAPWAAYVALPLFAFCATGVTLRLELHAPGVDAILAGVILGLVVGKPLGVCLAALLAVKAGIARLAEDTPLRAFIGAACLCGVGDTVALLMADQAFADPQLVAAAKIGVLAGSILAAALGAAIIGTGPAQMTPAAPADQASRGSRA